MPLTYLNSACLFSILFKVRLRYSPGSGRLIPPVFEVPLAGGVSPDPEERRRFDMQSTCGIAPPSVRILPPLSAAAVSWNNQRLVMKLPGTTELLSTFQIPSNIAKLGSFASFVYCQGLSWFNNASSTFFQHNRPESKPWSRGTHLTRMKNIRTDAVPF